METKRLPNFELLRIIAMLMIVMLHLLGNDHGNVLSKTVPYSAAYYVTWLIEALCIVGVNCYALISGYFLIESSFSWKKALRLAVIVWFYAILLFLVGVICKWLPLNLKTIFTAMTPITGRAYWYISVYFGLYLLSPFINILIRNLNRKQLRNLIVLCIVLFGILPTILPVYDMLLSGGGLGLAWFCTLYFIAAFIRLYGIEKIGTIQLTKWTWLIVYFCFALLIWISKIMIAKVTDVALGYTIGTSVFYQYESPLCLGESVALFMFFKDLKINRGWIIQKTAGLTLGVYLIHDNPTLRGKLWELVSPNVEGNILVFIAKLLIILVGIYIACSVIEWIREMLFNRIPLFVNNKSSNE